MGNRNVVLLNEINKDDIEIVGGKGANLGELIQGGFPVPDGFCVTTYAFDQFCDEIKEHQLFKALKVLDTEDLGAVDDLSSAIRGLIMESVVDEALVHQITGYVNRIGVDAFYAIRSSATAEDLPGMSFAGQQDTYLNIQGAESIIEHIKRCWASLYNDRAICYRAHNGVDHEQVSISVVIQEMVDAKHSGIMFTADPVTNNRNTLTIDAGFGLGEALVSGLVTPDLYKVDKLTGAVIEKQISEKKLAIRSKSSGGTYREDVDERDRKSQVLSEGQILALGELGTSIEAHYGYPQDIEWCVDADGKLHITQSRPITTLFPLPKRVEEDERLHVYVSFNHVQVMTETIKPLGQSMFRLLFPFGKADDNLEVPSPVLLPAGGWMYIDITDMANTFPFSKGLPKILKKIDILMASAVGAVLEEEKFKGNKKLKGVRKSFFKVVSPFIPKIYKNLKDRSEKDPIALGNDYVENYVENIQLKLETSTDGLQRLETVRATCSRLLLDDVERFGADVGTGIASLVLLSRELEKYPEGKGLADRLLTGLEGNVTTELGLMVGDLSDLIRDNPMLLEAIETKEPNRAMAMILDCGDDSVTTVFNRFIDMYGMRGIGEIDITKDKYREDWTPIVQSIKNNIMTLTPGEHRKKYAKLVNEASEAEKAIMKLLADHGTNKRKMRKVQRYIDNVRSYMPLREHPKYTIIRCLGLYKEIIKEEAAHLVASGSIETREDVYYLTFEELLDAYRYGTDHKVLIAERKEAYESYEKMTSPRVMTSEGTFVKGAYDRGQLPDNAHLGSPVSSGVVEGIAKVVADPKTAVIYKDEILIAPFTDPGWTPLFINAKGLVMEVGGMMTHGAVVAREYGIPAVVGVENAMEIIKTGDRIRIDGDRGYVEILAPVE